jgi:hypothetical protein
MSKDFTHGWNSSNYIFRVEVDGRLEHQYNFSIDGVSFNEMQRKRDMEVRKRNENDGAPRNKAPFAKPGQTTGGGRSGNPDRRFSNDGAGQNRGSFQSPDVHRKDPFDPFESSEAADPFGEDPFGDESSDVVAKGSKPAQTTPPPPVKPPVSLLDDDDEPPAARSSFTFGESSAPAFDPFGTAQSGSAPPSRRASDFSNDLAGLSYTVAPAKAPEQANEINPFAGSDSPSDEFFEEEPLPSSTVPPVSSAWIAPKNLVNLDFNAPSASSTTNAFSGRSPSLNLLLNGSSTRVQGSTGMNAPPVQSMGMNNSGQMGMNNSGQMGGQMGMNNNGQMGGQMGMNNNGQMGGQMGMNNNGQMGGQMGMNNNGQMGGQMGMNNNGPMGGRQMMGMGQMGQGQGMMQQQQYGQGGMMQGAGGGGMGGIQNNRMMMNNNMGQGQGQGQGMNMMSGGMGGMQGQGQGGMYNAGGSINLPSSSGSTSSLAGAGVARGIPTKNGPKSSLDTINWNM